jgi:hypothetical protein
MSNPTSTPHTATCPRERPPLIPYIDRDKTSKTKEEGNYIQGDGSGTIRTYRDMNISGERERCVCQTEIGYVSEEEC